MDEKMADMTSLHIWKKFLSLLASAGHSTFAGGLMVFYSKGMSQSEVCIRPAFKSSEMYFVVPQAGATSFKLGKVYIFV